MLLLGQKDRHQERGVLDAFDRVGFAGGQVEQVPGFEGLRLPAGRECHPASRSGNFDKMTLPLTVNALSHEGCSRTVMEYGFRASRVTGVHPCGGIF